MTKPVAGYEGLYEVGEDGSVYSVRKRKLLKQIIMPSGYSYVHLCDGKHHTKLARTHRLVADAFLEKEAGKDHVNHINGNKTDNRLVNLEWCSNLQNTRHAMRTGLFNPVGEHNPSAKLTKRQVEEIRSQYEKGSRANGAKALGRIYGISDVMVGKIVRHECWAGEDHVLHREEGDV